MPTTIRKNIFLFFACLLCGGFLCALTEQEVWWDFLTYHYYNAWAFLTGKTFENIGAAGVHSYFNPLPDLYTYLLVSLFNHHPRFVFFGQGLWLGALFFVVLKLIFLFLEHRTKLEKFSCVIAFAFSLLCYSVTRQAGTSTNEVPIAVLFLAGCYWLLKYLYKTHQDKKLLLFGSGLILGMACGLKMTVAPMAVVLGLYFLCFFRRINNPVKTYLIWGFSGLMGYLLTNGFWMFLLWIHFKNPFFPFFNNIFRSPFALPVYIRDIYLDPPDIWGYIFLPWNLMKFNNTTTDLMSRSFNIPLGLLAAFGSLFLKKKSSSHSFLIFFVLAAYLLWLRSLCMLRYAISLEVLSGILCVMWIMYFPKKIIPWCLTIILSLNIWALCVNHTWYQSRKDEHSYISVTAPPVDKDTIILVNGSKTSFIIPHIRGGRFAAGFNKKWRDSQPETEISAIGKLNPLFSQKAGKNPRYALIYESKNDNPNCSPIQTNLAAPRIVCPLPITPETTELSCRMEQGEMAEYFICPKAGSDGIIHGVPFNEVINCLK